MQTRAPLRDKSRKSQTNAKTVSALISRASTLSSHAVHSAPRPPRSSWPTSSSSLPLSALLLQPPGFLGSPPSASSPPTMSVLSCWSRLITAGPVPVKTHSSPVFSSWAALGRLLILPASQQLEAPVRSGSRSLTSPPLDLARPFLGPTLGGAETCRKLN